MSVGSTVLLGNIVEIAISTADGSSAEDIRIRVKARESATETELDVTISSSAAKATFIAPAAGHYDFRAWRPGEVPLAHEGSFYISPSAFAADPA